MLLELRIKLTTGFYGDGKKDYNRNIRLLDKLPNGDIKINNYDWLNKLQLAANDLELNVIIQDAVKLPTSFIPPTIRILKRKYYQSGLSKVEYFEGFFPNTEITMDLIFLPTEKSPTILELKKIFHIVGNFYGISPFGSEKFGLGRFNVIYLELKNACRN